MNITPFKKKVATVQQSRNVGLHLGILLVTVCIWLKTNSNLAKLIHKTNTNSEKTHIKNAYLNNSDKWLLNK